MNDDPINVYEHNVTLLIWILVLFSVLNLFADKIMATLGEGTFGRVVKVKDMQM